ncbi:unnamed protein product [Closterium sp. NIES-65]|nr:unnamed protein product [Closterium sp. NIES-65]
MSVIPMSPSQPAVSAAMTLAAKPVAGAAPLTAKSVSGGASLAADVVGDVWKADWYVAHCYKIPAMAQLNLVLSQVAQAPTRSDISLPSCGPADLKRFHRDLAELISSSEFAGKQLNVFLHAVHSTASGLQKDISKRLANENSSVSKNSRSATFSSGAQPPKSPTKPTFAARLRSRSLSGVTAAVALFRSPENAVPRSKDSAVARGTGEGGAAPVAESGEGVIARERAEAGADGVTIAGDVARNEVRGSGPFSFRLAPPSALAVGEAEGDEEERGLRGGREAGGAAALRGFLLVSMPRAATSAEAFFPSSTSVAVPATSLERSGDGGGGVGGRAGDVYGPRLTKSRSVAVERNRHSYSSGSISRGEGGRRGGRGKAEGGGEAGGGGEGGKRAGKPPPKSSHERLQEILKNVTIGGTRGGPLQMARAIARGGVGGSFGGSGPGGPGGGSASAGGMGSPRVWEGMDGQDGISRFHRGMSVAERRERGKGAGGGEGGSGGGNGGGARRFMPTSLSVVSRKGGEWGEEEMGEGWAEGEAEQGGAGEEGGEGSSIGASGSSNSQSPRPLLSPTAQFQPPTGPPVSPKRPALSKAKLQQEEMLLQLLRSTPPIRWSLASEGGASGSGGSARMGR